MLKQYLLILLAPLATIANSMSAYSRLWAHARLKQALPHLHPSVVVLSTPEIHGNANIELGKNAYLYRELYLETQDQGYIRVGDGVVISRGVHLVAFAGIEIGDGVMIGEYTSIRDANHRVVAGVSPRDTGHQAEKIHIGRNAWIGRGVTILAGVSIGEGAVVGANAVVTHDVAENTIVAGVPAQLIRTL